MDTPTLIKEERWYVDGEPGAVNSEPYGTGYFTFIFDDAGFASNMNTADEHTWERCEQTRVELQQESARKTAAAMGIKL